MSQIIGIYLFGRNLGEIEDKMDSLNHKTIQVQWLVLFFIRIFSNKILTQASKSMKNFI